MLLRIIVLTSLVALPLFAQDTPVPAKPKVVSTPTPKPKRKKPLPSPKVAKPADPLAAYVLTVKAAFAGQWVDAVTPRLKDFNPGAISVTFKLDAEGKVVDFKVVENTSNEAFAKFCEEFVRGTVFELPPDKVLTDGAVEIPFTFKII